MFWTVYKNLTWCRTIILCLLTNKLHPFKYFIRKLSFISNEEVSLPIPWNFRINKIHLKDVFFSQTSNTFILFLLKFEFNFRELQFYSFYSWVFFSFLHPSLFSFYLSGWRSTRQNMIDQNTIEQNTIDKNTIDQNTIDQNTIDQNVTELIRMWLSKTEPIKICLLKMQLIKTHLIKLWLFKAQLHLTKLVKM